MTTDATRRRRQTNCLHKLITSLHTMSAASPSFAPRAVLFDMDGVLASVGTSYRSAIVKTAERFGAKVTLEDISFEKKKGNANNDWVLSKRLIDARVTPDKKPTLQQVTDAFEELYQGTSDTPGLCETETLIPSKGLLAEVCRRCNGLVGVVTGRPRKDCMKFLKTHSLDEIFKISICMEDAPAKPDPKPVLLACEALGVDPSECIMIGDTPDDIRAAVSAGAIGYGVLTPEEDAKLILNMMESSQTMASSMLQCGATSVWRAGCQEILDLSFSKKPDLSWCRIGTISRVTKETSVDASVDLDGSGKYDVCTGIGFLDHMVGQMSKHGRFDISLKCVGDLYIDDHHTAEDCALALGEAFDSALGKRENIKRFGNAYCPLDEALSRSVIDISSRPSATINLNLTREMIGTISSEMLKHFLESFASSARITLHVHNIHGENNHHKVESAFKAIGVAMRAAVSKDISAGVPSTKGVLT